MQTHSNKTIHANLDFALKTSRVRCWMNCYRWTMNERQMRYCAEVKSGSVLIKQTKSDDTESWHAEFPNPNKNSRVLGRLLLNIKYFPCARRHATISKEGEEGGKWFSRVELLRRRNNLGIGDVTWSRVTQRIFFPTKKHLVIDETSTVTVGKFSSENLTILTSIINYFLSLVLKCSKVVRSKLQVICALKSLNFHPSPSILYGISLLRRPWNGHWKRNSGKNLVNILKKML